MIKCCLDSDFKVSNDLKKLKCVPVPRNHYFGQKLNQDYDEEKKRPFLKLATPQH